MIAKSIEMCIIASVWYEKCRHIDYGIQIQLSKNKFAYLKGHCHQKNIKFY